MGVTSLFFFLEKKKKRKEKEEGSVKFTWRHVGLEDVGNQNARLSLVQLEDCANDTGRSAHGRVKHVNIIRLSNNTIRGRIFQLHFLARGEIKRREMASRERRKMQ